MIIWYLLNVIQAFLIGWKQGCTYWLNSCIFNILLTVKQWYCIDKALRQIIHKYSVCIYNNQGMVIVSINKGLWYFTKMMSYNNYIGLQIFRSTQPFRGFLWSIAWIKTYGCMQKNEAGGRMFSFATISNFVLNLENDSGTV